MNSAATSAASTFGTVAHGRGLESKETERWSMHRRQRLPPAILFCNKKYNVDFTSVFILYNKVYLYLS